MRQELKQELSLRLLSHLGLRPRAHACRVRVGLRPRVAVHFVPVLLYMLVATTVHAVSGWGSGEGRLEHVGDGGGVLIATRYL